MNRTHSVLKMKFIAKTGLPRFANLILATLLIALSFAVSVEAGTLKISGSDNPEFRRGVELYLANRDAEALPLLAELARNGNMAAQYLLGRTDTFDGSDLFKQISRKARIKLMRTGKGPFGTRWINKLAETEELARLFMAAKSTYHKIPAVLRLVEIGEPLAAARVFISQFELGSPFQAPEWEFYLSAAENGVLPERAHYLVWLSALNMPEDERSAKYVQAFLDGIATIDPRILKLNKFANPRLKAFVNRSYPVKAMSALLSGWVFDQDLKDTETREIAETWLMSSPHTSPIAAICRTTCPQEVKACTRAAFAAMGGDYELTRAGSPIESLIPQSTYVNSSRFLADILRQASKYGADRFRRTSQCFYRMVADKSAAAKK